MEKTKTLTQIVLAGALSVVLSACGNRFPEVKKCEDLTGDGIRDILMCDKNRKQYLFIGKEDGTFISAEQIMDEKTRTIYFLTEDNTAYFFDGKFYQKAEKESENK